MKNYLYILFLFSFCLAQNNGIRSLNGSLSNSQRVVWDTTSDRNTFTITTSNGVHTLWFPYNRFALTGSGSVGNADSLGSHPASYYAVKADSQIVAVNAPLTLSRSLHTTTLSFAPASGTSYDSSRLAYLDKANIFTGTPQTFSAVKFDTVSDNRNNGGIIANDSFKVAKIFYADTSTSFTPSGAYVVKDTFKVVNIGGTGRAQVGDSLIFRGSVGQANAGGIAMNSTSTEAIYMRVNQNSQASFNLDNTLSGTGAQSAIKMIVNGGVMMNMAMLSSGFSVSYQKYLGVISNTGGGVHVRAFTGYPLDLAIGAGSTTADLALRVTKNGSITIGDTTEPVSRLSVTNKLLRNAQKWKNSRGDTLHIIDSVGGVYGTAFLADTGSFTTTAVRKAHYIQGAKSTDIYQVTWRVATGDETTVPTGIPYVMAKTDSAIIFRTDGTTSGQGYDLFRIRRQ